MYYWSNKLNLLGDKTYLTCGVAVNAANSHSDIVGHVLIRQSLRHLDLMFCLIVNLAQFHCPVTIKIKPHYCNKRII